jgi:nitroreductase
MELTDALRARRMVRSFADRPLDRELVDALVADALRAPTAGNTGGTAWLVLTEAGRRATYWEQTTTDDWRRRSRRWPGLSRAPVVALSLTSPSAYVARYVEADKAGSGLGSTSAAGDGGIDGIERSTGGEGGAGRGGVDARGGGASGEAAWPVPYWFGDAAFATMTLLLRAADARIGACFLGNFRGEAAVLAALGVPAGWRLFGTVLLGHPDGLDHRSASLDRPRPATAERLHHDRW